MGRGKDPIRDHVRRTLRQSLMENQAPNTRFLTLPILHDCAAGRWIEILDFADAPPSMHVGHNRARVDGEGFASHDPFLDAARDHGLERLAQQIALAKAAVTVLGKRRMVRNVAAECQATKPVLGQIEVELLAQPTLGANTEAAADDHVRIISSGSIDGRPTSLSTAPRCALRSDKSTKQSVLRSR